MPEIKDYKLYTKISRAVNYTFGDTGPGTARVSTQKVNLIPVDESILRAQYHSIVAFSNNALYEQLMRQHRQEAISMIEAALKKAKENYELLFPEETINFKINLNSCEDSVEFTYFVQGTPVKRGFFKLSCLVEIKSK